MTLELQAVFIDRDGTLGDNPGHFIHPRDFVIFPYTNEAISRLKSHNLKLFAYTNQANISDGSATVEDFEQEFRGYGFDDAYICCHALDAGCECRKPKEALMRKAAKEHNLDLTKCAMIGDTGKSDMIPANTVGALKILVRTGMGEKSLGEHRHRWEGIEPDYIADNILDAVQWLTAQMKKE